MSGLDQQMTESSMPSMRSVVEAIHKRQSPVKLREPAPDSTALDEMLMAGMCGPDHGRLKPWRFVVISREGRDALGNLLAESLKAREPESSYSALEREREKAFRAPTIVVVVARALERKSVPYIEQVIAAGIAAYNVLLAASMLGYGGMWRTGPAAYDQVVKSALGMSAGEELIGFLYLGTPEAPPPARKLPALEAYKTRWPVI